MENSEKKHSLSLFAKRDSRSLMKICGLLARRGYDIESLNFSHIRETGLAKPIIVINSDREAELVKSQLYKLIDTVHAVWLN